MQPSSSTLILHAFLGSVLLLSLVPDFVHGLSADTIIDSPLLTEKIGTNRTIKVDPEGKGDYKTIQEAIDAVPEGNNEWIIVHVRKGTYMEKLLIPATKPYIFLRGNGKGRTHVVEDDSGNKNSQSATLRIEANNVIVFGMSFKNDANLGLPSSFQLSSYSVAAMVGGDKIAFYHCAFYSAHNTLFDYKGRHYYDDCYIQGSIDFIFGRAQSVFQSCEIFVNADSRLEVGGSITAQTKGSAEETSGFVFLKGKVYGIGGIHLGRPKGPFSRVVFAKTYLSNAIVPKGWTDWRYNGTTENIFHAEYDCKGPGSWSKLRAPWAKQLTEKEAAPFLSVDFIQGKEWLPAWRAL